MAEKGEEVFNIVMSLITDKSRDVRLAAITCLDGVSRALSRRREEIYNAVENVRYDENCRVRDAAARLLDKLPK